MHRTDGSITTNTDESIVTDHLMTYSEEEKQENEINAANAKLVFSPSHIQYYPSIKSKYNLTHIETLLYGFIAYYLHIGVGRFYFTNDQLATVLDCSVDTIKTAIQSLTKCGLVEFSYKIKAGGGTIRFATRLVKNPPSDGGKFTSPTVENSAANKNKINKRLVSKDTNGETPKGGEESIQKIQGWGNPQVNQILKEFSEVTGLSKPTDVKPQFWAWTFARSKSMGVDRFRPCLEFIQRQWGGRILVTKIEQVYRHFPEYEAAVLKKPKSKLPKVTEFTADGYVLVEE